MAQISPEIFSVQNWVRVHLQETQKSHHQINDEDEEALSMCDLATNEHDDPEATNEHDDPEEHHHQQQRLFNEQEDDFAFTGGSCSPEVKMCSADELFYRGQILPLRHSVTLPSRSMTRTREFTRSISVSRSEPVSGATSRSSSMSSSTSRSEFHGYSWVQTRNRDRNQFHSHPSPTPQIRTRTRSYRQSDPKVSSKWRFLQLGPLKVQEIGLADLKNRSERRHRRYESEDENEKKKKDVLWFGGCKCSADVIESAVSSRILMVKETTLNVEEEEEDSNVGRRKHAVSGHRTSEWFKQLFVQRNDSL